MGVIGCWVITPFFLSIMASVLYRAAINSDFVRVFGLFGHHKPTRTDFYKLGIFFVFAHAHLLAPPRPASERERRWSPTTIILGQQSTKWTSAIP